LVTRFGQIIENVARSMDCEAKYDIQSITTSVVNDAEVTRRVQKVAGRLVPQDELDFSTIIMGSEDMAFVMQQIPGCYFFVGSANKEKGLNYTHHHAKFDFDEVILPKAAALMAASAVEFLGK
jgi:metal-dependent amidase/aminoacylase/carboxypeptidase family protein